MAEKENQGDASEESPEGAKAAKGKAMRRIAIIVAVLVVDLALMGGVAYYVVNRLKDEDPVVRAARELEVLERKKREERTEMGTVLDKPLDLTVNIGGPGESHYLKCAVQLEWDGHAHPTLGEEIKKRLPKITDIIIGLLSTSSLEELLRPQGKQRLREAIIAEVNATLPNIESADHGKGQPASIRNAYFTEFLVQ